MYFFFLGVDFFFLHVCLYTTLCLIPAEAREGIGPFGAEVTTAVSHHVGAGSGTWVLCTAANALNHRAIPQSVLSAS